MNSLAVNSSNKSTEDLLKMWQENEMISINNMDEIEQSYQEIEETEECWIYLHFFKITDNQGLQQGTLVRVILGFRDD